jgi:hypothetical protein
MLVSGVYTHVAEWQLMCIKNMYPERRGLANYVKYVAVQRAGRRGAPHMA